MLPSWSDEAIMECDLGRLQIALGAAREQIESDWRQWFRIGGFKVDEPTPEPEDDEAFNEQLRATLSLMRRTAE